MPYIMCVKKIRHQKKLLSDLRLLSLVAKILRPHCSLAPISGERWQGDP